MLKKFIKIIKMGILILKFSLFTIFLFLSFSAGGFIFMILLIGSIIYFTLENIFLRKE